jgi:predicted amidohydrolase YtcJ
MAEPADLILADADVWVGDAARRWAHAVAIGGDRVLAVGTNDDVRPLKGPSTQVLSLPGRAIVPGFQDAHIHPAFAGRNLMNVNLDDLATREAYLARIREVALANPDLPWIVGGGWYSPAFAATDGPRREDLDAVVPDRPAFLINTDVHAGWANTHALAWAGISADTPDPWDGYLVRDPDGSPSGCLQEGAAYALLRRILGATEVTTWKSYLLRAQRELHAVGVTGWQDAWVEPDVLRAYRELDDEGALTMRAVTALWWDRHRGNEQIDGFVEQRTWGTGGNVHASTVKVMLDGCPESGTGWMLQPYEGTFGEHHGTGLAFLEPDALADALVRLDALGFQVHQHALGDGAVRSALDAVAAARSANGPNDLRHHVAHLQLPQPEDLPRLRRLSVVANVQPFWAYRDGAFQQLTLPRVGAERATHLYPIADLRRAGAVLAMGSDWPVSTPNPWLELEVAVTRQPPGDPDAEPLDAGQRIDLGTGMAAFARGSAYVNHDDDAGTLEAGRRADLAVLDRNPFDRTTGAIGETRVLMTLASGRVVFDAS